MSLHGRTNDYPIVLKIFEHKSTLLAYLNDYKLYEKRAQCVFCRATD